MIMDQSENDIPLLHDASGALKARDAALFVVGVGSGMDDPSIKKVASKNDYAFHSTSFSELMSVAPLLSDQICPLKGIFQKNVSYIFQYCSYFLRDEAIRDVFRFESSLQE